MTSRNRRVLALATLLVGALLVPLTVTGTGVSDALWAETKTVSLGTVTLTAGDPEPEPEQPQTNCDAGQVWDLFLGCVTPGGPGSVVDPTTWQCVGNKSDPEDWNLQQHDETTCVDPDRPLDDPTAANCAEHAGTQGRWYVYKSQREIFTATDREYTLTVAMPPGWVQDVATSKYVSNPQLLIRGRRAVINPTQNIWVGHFHPDTVETDETRAEGEYKFLDEARTEPVSIAISVDRDTGGGSEMLPPAYMILILDITDERGQVRRISGATLINGYVHGALPKCNDFRAYTWPQAQLDALGFGWPTPYGPGPTP